MSGKARLTRLEQSRRQAEMRSHSTRRFESCRIIDCCTKCKRCDRANARNGHQPATNWVVVGQGFDQLIKNRHLGQESIASVGHYLDQTGQHVVIVRVCFREDQPSSVALYTRPKGLEGHSNGALQIERLTLQCFSSGEHKPNTKRLV